jgi:hypothetical protein
VEKRGLCWAVERTFKHVILWRGLGGMLNDQTIKGGGISSTE